ncbi:PRA1 family protein 3 [Anthonomus grandis grandis]|uniref:PRA1 family protein 3 n=1 Tax=Anthonomus grandis grandis TaxID=2921223 RepID=UPI002165307D|nr:PRA1 family protein 3 [Anthonomus grandis grandis]
MSKKGGESVTIVPLRPLDDFLLDSARFQIPNFQDLEKWGNRVTSNLLYYQSNYCLLAISIFVLIGVIHPIKMIVGCLTTFLIFAIFIYLTNEKVAAAHFKQKHPIISLAIIFGSLYLIAHMLQSVLVFFLGILLPFSVIFVHASLRLRNFRNKIVNKVEVLGLRRTPMGIFLQEMGLDSEAF